MKTSLSKITKNNQGALLVLALVFTGLFTVVALGLTGMIGSQYKLGIKETAWNKSLAIAEAGINYYRWHLAHAPEDYTDGTGEAGPYVHRYKDNLGNEIGSFSLEITSPPACSNSVIIESTGWLDSEPEATRTIKVKYGRPSLAQFAFLSNSNIWFGDEENLNGPLHSNGGIRMDGYNLGVTTSAKDEYICGTEHGCSYETKPGVWGNGGNQILWDYPVDNVDFNAITTDISTLKTIAEASDCGGTDCHWPQQGLGYHLRFNADGTFDLWRVTKLKRTEWGYDGERWEREAIDIDRQSYVGQYTIPGNCGIIFIEDDLWIDGILDGKVTVVAARINSGQDPRIIINGNLVYESKAGDDVLGLIAENDILIGLTSAEDNLEINGAIMSQTGKIMRKYYCYSNCSRRVRNSSKNYILRDSITVYGSIITNKMWTWSWVDGSNTTISGYENTETIYDTNLTYNPPPGFPTTGEYTILQWEEITEKK